jgi:hypothetical protein
VVEILKREHTRLRVKACELPLSMSGILGAGIDVMSLPEGHLSCPVCYGFKFECWVYLDNHRLELGCMKCGWSCRLLFPLDIDLMPFGKSGRYTCMRWDKETHTIPIHRNCGMIIIHNTDVLSIGCEKCRTEVDIKLKTKNNLVLAS